MGKLNSGPQDGPVAWLYMNNGAASTFAHTLSGADDF